jgi:hypothetical protein
VSIAHLDHAWAKQGQGPSPIVAVHQGDFRLIHDYRKPDVDTLYKLPSDPFEHQDVAGEFPGIVAALRARVDAYLEQAPVWAGGAPEIELDEMHLRQLRALGYSVEDQ